MHGAALLEELDAEVLVDELELLEEVVLLVELLLEAPTLPPEPPAPPLPLDDEVVAPPAPAVPPAPPAAPEEEDEDVTAPAPLLELAAELLSARSTATCGPQATRAIASAA